MGWRQEIQQAYDNAQSRTEALWQKSADIGVRRATPFFHPALLCQTIAIKPPLNSKILALLAQLRQLTEGDSLAEVMSSEAIHFTYLAIGTQKYGPEKAQDISPDLLTIFEQCCADQPVHISGLRLLALADQILLAGFPDEHSYWRRQDLTARVLGSSVREEVLACHKGAIPQVFWHSTLMRYNAERMPTALRQFVIDHIADDYGEVLSTLRLVLTDYRWERTLYLR
ncbi:hypothetical protein LLQ46_17225 [Rouxiella badensis]|uniref:hypothetical protein n=1 Tax=Rouxiella badensis TaxID=1646377 RepID=UPI001B55EC29|nr:hypothetical protein [Rouxiella badensis]MCC3748592.1 hypothetical protein [Rouxiella badensis]